MANITDANTCVGVYASAFYLDSNSVTYGLWLSVNNWATNHGYNFDDVGMGKTADNPVQTVNWYDTVKWCNARSEMAGLTPCYYTGASQTTVYRTGDMDLSNSWVKWTVKGCRLPTEAEWEKAARGWFERATVSMGEHHQRNPGPTTRDTPVMPMTWGRPATTPSA